MPNYFSQSEKAPFLWPVLAAVLFEVRVGRTGDSSFSAVSFLNFDLACLLAAFLNTSAIFFSGVDISG